MRKVIYSLGVSLDGFMEAPNGDIDWTNPGDDLFRFHLEQARQNGGSLYGRRLYENMSAYWPTADQDPVAPPLIAEFARLWRATPKYVFSTTLTQVGWNSHLIRGDLATEVEKLKAAPGGDLDLGGAGLASSLMRLGLIDEYHLFTYPVVLGGGTPFFPALDERIELRLLETRTFEGGVVYTRYTVR